MTEFHMLAAAVVMGVCALGLMALEAFVPGVSVAGLAGLLLMGTGAYLSWRGFGFVAAAAYLAVLLVLSFFIMRCVYRSMKSGRLSKSGVFLNEESAPVMKPNSASAQAEIGKMGASKTALRPTGIAEFDGERVHVTALEGFIEPSVPVRIVRVEGGRIIVERADERA